MMRSGYVTLIYLAFLLFGASAPFVFSLGYVWVDTFNPQAVATEVLSQIPVSLIMAALATSSFLLFDHRKTRPTATTWLLLLFAIWITLSTAFWAVMPNLAWVKWDPSFKTICFAAFIPLVFRSRIQIEALMQIYVFSIAVHFLPGGVKTLVSGGGYGLALGILGGNSLLAEGSTLCAVALMLIPIIFFLRRHTLLIPKSRFSDVGYGGLVVTALAAAIGTYERTALIGMAVGGFGLWIRAKRKLLFGLIGLAAVALLALVTSDQWTARISTIQHFNSEGSALARILVWKWTLNFVKDHPFGGGFNSYVLDQVILPSDDGSAPIVRNGVAFHSIYFEVLGEQGYVGFLIFATIIATAFLQLRAVGKLSSPIDDLHWARDLANALQVSLAVLLSCGSFVGIGFQPMIYLLIAVSGCLRSHVREALTRSGSNKAAVSMQAADC